MSEEVKRLIAKAEHALEVAKELMKIGYPSDGASKIYYSLFYAAQAPLKRENLLNSNQKYPRGFIRKFKLGGIMPLFIFICLKSLINLNGFTCLNGLIGFYNLNGLNCLILL